MHVRANTKITLTQEFCIGDHPQIVDTVIRTDFEEKAIRWYPDLLLHHDVADDMTGFDNRILIAYGMCPPCKTMEYYQLDPCIPPSGFMQGTTAEVWGDDTHEAM